MTTSPSAASRDRMSNVSDNPLSETMSTDTAPSEGTTAIERDALGDLKRDSPGSGTSQSASPATSTDTLVSSIMEFQTILSSCAVTGTSTDATTSAYMSPPRYLPETWTSRSNAAPSLETSSDTNRYRVGTKTFESRWMTAGVPEGNLMPPSFRIPTLEPVSGSTRSTDTETSSRSKTRLDWTVTSPWMVRNDPSVSASSPSVSVMEIPCPWVTTAMIIRNITGMTTTRGTRASSALANETRRPPVSLRSLPSTPANCRPSVEMKVAARAPGGLFAHPQDDLLYATTAMTAITAMAATATYTRVLSPSFSSDCMSSESDAAIM